MVAESSEFHLTLSRAHRVHLFQQEIPRKKRDILSEKRESGMVLKKRELNNIMMSHACCFLSLFLS